jgi:hypothetical protein
MRGLDEEQRHESKTYKEQWSRRNEPLRRKGNGAAEAVTSRGN